MKTDSPVRVPRDQVVAVEPGAEWFKLVKLRVRRNAPELTALCVRRMGELGDRPGRALGEHLRTLGLVGIPAIATLPRQMVNLRLLELPSEDPQEIADMVDLQIAHQTPYAREEIVYDYRPVGARGGGYTRVMLVIAQSSMLRQRFQILEEAGLDPVRMTISTEGLLAGFGERARGLEGERAAVLVDVDAGHTEVAILRAGGLVFSRSVVIGARQLLAERDRWEARFVQEVGRAIEAYRSESAGASVAGITLTGAGTRVPGLAEGLQSALDLPVELQEDLAGIPRNAAPSQPDGDAVQAVSLAGLAGAALNPGELVINLLPASVRARRELVAKAGDLTRLGILTMAATALVSLLIVGSVYRRTAYLEELQQHIQRTDPEANQVETMHRKVGLLAERLGSGLVPAKVMTELTALAPEEVSLTSIQIENGQQVTVRGAAGAVSDVLKYVSALEAAPLFQNVKSSTRTASGRGGRMEFEILCNVERTKP